MEIHVEDVQGEEREGFYVQPMMKRMWFVQLDILNVIRQICRRHAIRYYGWYGTLLGAVRHHGFIPWDDDLDLVMLREDLERFLHFAETELPDGWKVLKADPTLIRVLNTGVIRWDQDFLDRFHGCPFVMGVDIFCFDYIPQNKADEDLWTALFVAVYDLYKYWDFLEKEDTKQERWEQLKRIEELTGCHFNMQLSLKEQLYTLAEKIAAMYRDTGALEAANVAELHVYPDQRVLRTCFDRMVEVPFEDTTIPILEDYDTICRSCYGDRYMTPVKGEIHSAVKTQMDVMREHFRSQGKELPECCEMLFT